MRDAEGSLACGMRLDGWYGAGRVEGCIQMSGTRTDEFLAELTAEILRFAQDDNVPYID